MGREDTRLELPSDWRRRYIADLSSIKRLLVMPRSLDEDGVNTINAEEMKETFDSDVLPEDGNVY